MTEIGASSLSGCTSLKSISIPNNITSISTYAFSYSALTSITIPTNVKEIGEGAFYNCDNLMEIHCEAANPPTVDSKFTFEGIPTTCILYVPTGCAPNYEIGYWISFKYNTIEE